MVAGVVASTCRADLLLFARETNVLESAGLDEPMAKLLTVLLWPYVGGGEADPRRRRTAWQEELRCGGGGRSWSGNGEAQNGVVELARVQTAWPRLQLLAVEGVAVEVAVDDDVGVSAPA